MEQSRELFVAPFVLANFIIYVCHSNACSAPSPRVSAYALNGGQ